MMNQNPTKDFHLITETPGVGASREQLSIFYTRYKFAADFCRGKDVLEVACGTGQGLGFLAHFARRVVGGDIDDKNLKIAAEKYRNRKNIEIQKMDAHEIHFPDDTFDVILLYEAIYYLERPERFLEECRRVLRKNGVLLITTVNPEWPDFNPSPLSTHYFSSRELRALMNAHQFKTELLGAFLAERNGLKSTIISVVKRSAVRLGVIPKSMKGKEWLKRVFFGRLSPLPAEVTDDMAPFQSPLPMTSPEAARCYKFVYAVGKK